MLRPPDWPTSALKAWMTGIPTEHEPLFSGATHLQTLWEPPQCPRHELHQHDGSRQQQRKRPELLQLEEMPRVDREVHERGLQQEQV
jgi:hypothetical protein